MVERIGRQAIRLHRKAKGKLAVLPKVDCSTKRGLSLAYTPGVAAVSQEIARKPDAVYELTSKWNTVAVVSDGSRVLGLGNIGPLAALPVMEGKAALFKSYAAIDAWPICLSCRSEDEVVAAVEAISPSFGGINLEDIESPKCFSVERRLVSALDIPVFHDDQHGTAVVALAGLANALELVGKKKQNAKVVLAGAGAAGYAIAKLLVAEGFSEVLVCDRSGLISRENAKEAHKRELAEITNRGCLEGSLKDALAGADAFIGVSSPNILSAADVKSMASSPIIFALSNPVPEISPAEAKKGGAAIYGTARADLPNQINNVLGFPGIFRGALFVRARRISDAMKLAASHAIAKVLDGELSEEKVVPDAFDRRVVPAVARAVAAKAMQEGLARIKRTRRQISCELEKLGLE
ncbi:MAG: NADP-dependent malic enzyme [Candidatus Micrarchaeota archaeon]|nr:NADP-dependent malic enzyme [Candidatus Micrarchaeota archaeon]